MYKRIWLSLVLSLAAILALVGGAFAQGPVNPEPQITDPAWVGQYWNNRSLSGSAALTRSDADINFDWGGGSPSGSIQSDDFSARWSRYIYLPAGVYRFTGVVDDGMRVTVDGKRIIDFWGEHAAQTLSGDISLGAGDHLVVVEYMEISGQAVAKLSWATIQSGGGGWRGEYYNNNTLSGSSVLVRDDAGINFDWGDGSPAPGVVNADFFSARWTRTVNLSAGTHRFTMTVDDGGRLWVNDHLLIDAWKHQAATTYTGDLWVPGGATTIRMEYYEDGGRAVARLSFDGSAPDSSGTVIVDDSDAGFVRGGSATGWHTAPEGNDGNLSWTRNNDRVRTNYNWARWYPDLTAGRYEVFVYIPERYTTTAGARYWVSHAGGYAERSVNQSAHGSQWVSLGTYNFRGDRSDYVSLSDVTYEPYLTRLIGFDAVKWVPR